MARELEEQQSGPQWTTGLGSADSSVALVPFIFGMTGLIAIPGTVLIRLLVDLGLSEPAARTLLARMRANGSLSSTRVDRRTQYRLIGSMRESFDRIQQGQPSSPQEWAGAFHAIIYWIPESDRAFRDSLRTATVRGGYATLRPGLLINPRDAFDGLNSLIATAPAGAYVVRAKIELSLDDARETAHRAWSLTELAANYRTAARQLSEASSQVAHLEPNAQTVHDYHAQLSRLTHLQLHDPGLPRELLPTDWPIDDVLQARRAFIHSWGHVVATRVYQTIIDTGTLSIAQFDPRLSLSQYAPIGAMARQDRH